MKLGLWLTEKRIRMHGLLLAVCLWTIYAADMSTSGVLDRNGLVKGTDFLHFYTLGTLARLGRGDLLYDIRAQAELMQKLLPEAPNTLYVPLYGPQVSMFFAPFTRLSYQWALSVWLAVNLLVFAFCCHAVWKKCSHLQPYPFTVVILAIAFPGLFHLLAWGQTSGVALLCFTLGFLALQANKPVLAGFAIGSLIFKPQLGLAAAVLFLLTREWKIIAGALIGVFAQLAPAWGHFGTEVMRTYWHALLHVEEVSALLEPRLYQTHSLRSFWSLLLPWPRLAFALYVLTGLGILAFTARCWRSKASLEIRYAALLFATVLLSPHLTVYDLVILAPAFLLLGDCALAHREYAMRVSLLLYACYPLFLLGPLAWFTHLQLSVVAMTGLVWTTWQMTRRSSALLSPAASHY